MCFILFKRDIIDDIIFALKIFDIFLIQNAEINVILFPLILISSNSQLLINIVLYSRLLINIVLLFILINIKN